MRSISVLEFVSRWAALVIQVMTAVFKSNAGEDVLSRRTKNEGSLAASHSANSWLYADVTKVRSQRTAERGCGLVASGDAK
jgi:hypothetical protein